MKSIAYAIGFAAAMVYAGWAPNESDRLGGAGWALVFGIALLARTEK